MTLHLNNGVGIPKGSTLKTHSLMGPNFEFVCLFLKYTSVSQKETQTGCPQRTYLSQSQKRERTFGQRHGERTAEGGWSLNEGLVCSPGSGGPNCPPGSHHVIPLPTGLHRVLQVWGPA